MDQDGNVLDILVQSRRDKKAAKKFFRKLLKGCKYAHGSSSRISRTVMGLPSGRCSRGWNTANIDISTTARRTPTNPPPAGAAHAGFKSPGHAQRFLAAFGPIAHHFRPRRHRLSASAYRQELRHQIRYLAGTATPPQLCIKSQTKGRSTPSCPRIMLIGNKLAIPKEGAMTIAGDLRFRDTQVWSTKSARCSKSWRNSNGPDNRDAKFLCVTLTITI